MGETPKISNINHINPSIGTGIQSWDPNRNSQYYSQLSCQRTFYLTKSMAYGKSSIPHSKGPESTQILSLTPISLISILILSSNLHQGIPKSVFLIGLPVKMLNALLPSSNYSNKHPLTQPRSNSISQ